MAPRVDGGVSLRIGESFVGEQRSFRRDRTASLRAYGKTGATELNLPDVGELAMVSVGAASLVAYDSQPSHITLSGEAFTAYLREDGLDDVLAYRADAGATQVEGRERYRRSLKTILQPGAFTIRTGQSLELVPLADPTMTSGGKALPVQLLFRGKPLPGALVRAWSWKGTNLVVVSARTTTDGTVVIELPHPGTWMLSTVHMIRLLDAPDADWESIWASLTFEALESSAVKATSVIHGAPSHGVPGLWALSGYRIGANALKRFGLAREQAFELEVTHRSPQSIRYTCMADGVMAATGVSPGKLNLSLEKVQAEEELETVVTHRKTKRQLVYKLKKEFRARIRETDYSDFPKASKLLDTLSDGELFTVEERVSEK